MTMEAIQSAAHSRSARKALLASALAALTAATHARLAESPSDIPECGLRVRLPDGARAVAVPPAKAEFYRRPKDGRFELIKAYNPRDVWWERALVGEWRDAGGGVIRLARVLSRAPEAVDFGERMGRSAVDNLSRERIEARLAVAEAAFRPGDPAARDGWRRDWNGLPDGDFFRMADAWWYVEFAPGRRRSAADARRTVADFIRSASAMRPGDPPRPSTGWWRTATPDYVFTTDLDRAEGSAFIDEALRLMTAMRRLYAERVPSDARIGAGRVRVFATRADYRAYRGATGWNETFSSGAWDPGRDELLICADDRALARKTMRHEAFHQYLHYATAGAHHAIWFNEGLACLFENVAADPATGAVGIAVEGPRAEAVARDPRRHAEAIPALVGMSPREFYSGDTGFHYATAWLLALFLDSATDTDPDFAPYRDVIPRYRERIDAGADPQTATAYAWQAVRNRDIPSDVMRFWKRKSPL